MMTNINIKVIGVFCKLIYEGLIFIQYYLKIGYIRCYITGRYLTIPNTSIVLNYLIMTAKFIKEYGNILQTFFTSICRGCNSGLSIPRRGRLGVWGPVEAWLTWLVLGPGSPPPWDTWIFPIVSWAYPA